MRNFDSTKYRGLNHSFILHREVNADLTDVVDGDTFINNGTGRLIYYVRGFKIYTNDPNHYLLSEDLKNKFINERKERFATKN